MLWIDRLRYLLPSLSNYKTYGTSPNRCFGAPFCPSCNMQVLPYTADHRRISYLCKAVWRSPQEQ